MSDNEFLLPGFSRVGRRLKSKGKGTKDDPLVLYVALDGDSLQINLDGDSIQMPSTFSSEQSGEWTVGAVQSGEWTVGGSVEVTESVLPDGAATENTLGSIDGKTPPLSEGRVPVEATQVGVWDINTAEKTMVYKTGLISTPGDNTLIPAPGVGNRLVISVFITQNESTSSTTLIWKSGNTALGRHVAETKSDGLAMILHPGRELKCGANEAFVLNLSSGNSTGYTLHYYVEAS
jgi:hypothetical protein